MADDTAVVVDAVALDTGVEVDLVLERLVLGLTSLQALLLLLLLLPSFPSSPSEGTTTDQPPVVMVASDADPRPGLTDSAEPAGFPGALLVLETTGEGPEVGAGLASQVRPHHDISPVG